MKNTKHHLRAFTLIEALVTLAIISIMSVILLVGLSNSRTTQQLESAAREVEAAIREAQNYALTGYQDVANSDPCRFQILSTAGTPNYSIIYFYKDSNDACNRQDTIASYSLRNGVVFSAVSNFYYTLPYAKASFDSTDGTVEKSTILLTLSGASHVVCVYDNGLINNRSGTSCP